MENNNKYYTPEIEEFYVGFEYEVYNWGGWMKQIYEQNSFLQMWGDEYEFEKIEPGYIRVKYLDKEDVESLGWVVELFDLPSGDSRSVYKLGHHVITSWIVYDDNGLTIDISTLPQLNNGSLNRVFRGKLKNKSELKKLMKQLGIL
jgi:hypothetical protein